MAEMNESHFPNKKEIIILRRHFSRLRQAISDPGCLGTELYSANILARRTLQIAHGNGPVHDKNFEILDDLMSRLYGRPDTFLLFLSIIEQYPNLELIAKEMKAEYGAIADCSSSDDLAPPIFKTKCIAVGERIRKEFDDMTGKLGVLVTDVYEIAETNNVDFDKLKRFLMISCSSITTSLQNASCLGDIFIAVRKLCTPVNYSLLTRIADRYNLKEAKEIIENYKLDEENYRRKLLHSSFTTELKTEIDEIICNPSIQETIILKLKWSKAEEATVSEFEEVIKDIFEELTCYIHLLQVIPGSVIFKLWAPSYVIESLVRLAKYKHNLLAEIGVLSLTIGKTNIYKDCPKGVGDKNAAVDRVVQLEQHFKVLKEICQEKLEEIEYLKQGHPDLQEVTEGSHDSIETESLDEEAIVSSTELTQSQAIKTTYDDSKQTIETTELETVRKELAATKRLSHVKTLEIEKLRKQQGSTQQLQQVREGVYKFNYSPQTTASHQLIIKIGQDDICDILPVIRSTLNKARWIHCLPELHGPWGIAVNKDNIVVSEYYGDCISVYDKNMSKMITFASRGARSGHMDSPCGITLSRDNHVIVADSGNHRLNVFTLQGQFISTTGSKGTGPLEFDYPIDIAIHPTTNNIYVSDSYNHRIQVLGTDFTFKSFLSVEGMRPWGLAFTKEGHLLVVDDYNQCIQEFSSNDVYIGQFTKKDESNDRFGMAEARCITVHDDTVYISDTGKDQVYLFTAKGEFIQKLGDRGSARGYLRLPYGLAVDDTGILYVCDFENNRVQLF